MSLKEHVKFFGQYVLKPRAVGAVSPSSPSLARKMLKWIDWPNVGTVVEYGPGTGAFTKHILSRMHPGTRFLAIEVNPNFISILSRRYPEVRVYQDSVENVQPICRQEGIDEVDVIISGLPWASFRKKDQAKYLRAMMGVLRPGGCFATFAYWQGRGFFCRPGGGFAACCVNTSLTSKPAGPPGPISPRPSFIAAAAE